MTTSTNARAMGNAKAMNAPCVCTDPEVEKLRELVASGMDQREASRLLWGPKPGQATS